MHERFLELPDIDSVHCADIRYENITKTNLFHNRSFPIFFTRFMAVRLAPNAGLSAEPRR
jgi:hypothetical protein